MQSTRVLTAALVTIALCSILLLSARAQALVSFSGTDWRMFIR